MNSGLVKKQITDRNGKRTTVWVKAHHEGGSKFNAIYNKYQEKNWFGDDEAKANMYNAYLSAKEKGTLGDDVKGMSDEDVQKRIAEIVDTRSKQNFDGYVEKIKKMITSRDVQGLKERVRYDQKMSQEIYETFTGTSLKGKSNKQLADYFDSTYGGKSNDGGGEAGEFKLDMPKGIGYWDLTKYPYGGDFKRLTGDEKAKIDGSGEVYGKPTEIRLKLSDGRKIAIKKQYVKGLSGEPKVFYQQDNVGSAKYTVNFHDGMSTHKDGSPFFDIRTFKNIGEVRRFVDGLKKEGYKVRPSM